MKFYIFNAVLTHWEASPHLTCLLPLQMFVFRFFPCLPVTHWLNQTTVTHSWDRQTGSKMIDFCFYHCVLSVVKPCQCSFVLPLFIESRDAGMNGHSTIKWQAVCINPQLKIVPHKQPIHSCLNLLLSTILKNHSSLHLHRERKCLD